MRRLPQALNSIAAAGHAGYPLRHESAVGHVTGQASYVDDRRGSADTLYAYPGLSTIARGNIVSMDLTAVQAAPGVVDVITVSDIRGHRDIGAVFPGDPLLADGEVLFYGQVLFVVVADSQLAARRAARMAQVDYAPVDSHLDVEEALAQA